MHEPAIERADGGETAVHGLLGVACAVEVCEVGAQLTVADGSGEHALALGPGGEGCEIGTVGADRLRREPADILQIGDEAVAPAAEFPGLPDTLLCLP